MDVQGQKYREQHHNTVRYFEAQLAQKQFELNRYQQVLPEPGPASPAKKA